MADQDSSDCEHSDSKNDGRSTGVNLSDDKIVHCDNVNKVPNPDAVHNETTPPNLTSNLVPKARKRKYPERKPMQSVPAASSANPHSSEDQSSHSEIAASNTGPHTISQIRHKKMRLRRYYTQVVGEDGATKIVKGRNITYETAKTPSPGHSSSSASTLDSDDERALEEFRSKEGRSAFDDS